jgi:hypothetical protein
MKTIVKSIIILIVLNTMVLLSCKKENSYGTMTIKMTDAPALYEEVNVEIKRVEVHFSDETRPAFLEKNAGWIDLRTNAGVYNLLELRNGVTTVLAHDEKVQVGKITQMRLILGENNTVKVSGRYFDLNVPSGTETGIKLNMSPEIKSGIHSEIIFDFDAEQSVVITGSEKYQLKPVIKVVKQ